MTDLPQKTTLHLFISGRVQGVSYRAWLQQQALSLGIAGWARNRGTGEVEALLHGPAENLKTLVAACHQGPLLARVDKVTTEAAEYDGRTGFHIESTV